MQQQVQDIVNQTATKTAKIKQLILLGFTRTEIAGWITNSNYGMVQNVYARMKADGELTPVSLLSFSPLPFDRKFGIEIEAYNIDRHLLARKLREAGIEANSESYNHELRNTWKIVTDGSLNGNQTFEVVSPILIGENGLEQVRKVCEVLHENNALINKSCGLHVHFCAEKFDLKQWKNLYKNYALLEPVIDSLMPQSRRDNNNQYCKSLNSKQNLHIKIDQSRSLQEIAVFFGQSRYFKINPLSYSRHNTVEFRQHSGTIEFSKIQNWVVFLHNLVSYSKDNLNTDSTFEALKNFNQSSITTFYHNRKADLSI
jgi:hypothetical protein